MLKENLRLLKRLLFVADLSLIAFGFQLSVILNDIRFEIRPDIFRADHLIIPTLIIWGLVFWYKPNCYYFRLRKTAEIIASVLKASLISSGIYLSFLFVLGYWDESRLQVIFFLSFGTSFAILIRLAIILLLKHYRSRGFNYRTILIIGTGKVAKDFVDKIFNNMEHGLKIIGFLDWEKRADLWSYNDIPCLGHLDKLSEILKSQQVDIVTFAVNKRYLGTIEKSMRICEEMGIQVAVLADFFPMRLAKKRIDTFFGSPVVYYNTVPDYNFTMVIKQIVDRGLAFLGLIFASPILFIVGLMVKLSSKGPIIFKQQRCGLNGKKFMLYKFRSMVCDAEAKKKELMKFNEVNGAAFKMKDDPRITQLGKFMRKTSIDELPQLFNVLKGDMSLVGPRPPLADEVANYDLWQRRKLSMKPGLTCLWQVSGRSDISFEQWMKLDLKYIDNWSLWQDAKIMARTIPALIKGTGAR